ncbi:MAG: hypothetical protein AAGF36_02185 [Pseudomonadota bacterium]
MMIVILFILAFVVGPALFFALDRAAGRPWPLALGVTVLVLASFVVRDAGAVEVTPARGLASIALIWLAWVLVMVLGARAAGRFLDTPRDRRLARVIGAVGTTLPWFGFAASQWMAR